MRSFITIDSNGIGRVTLADVGLFSDGTAVKLVGEETFRIARALVDDYVVVDTDAVCAAIKDVFQDTRSILEPAGALAVAGAKAWAAKHKLRNETLVAVASGAKCARCWWQAEDVGRDDVVDYVSVSLSSSDYIGHRFGPGAVVARVHLVRQRVLAQQVAEEVVVAGREAEAAVVLERVVRDEVGTGAGAQPVPPPIAQWDKVTGVAFRAYRDNTLAELQRQCRGIYVDPNLIQYAVRLVSATRRPAARRWPRTRRRDSAWGWRSSSAWPT